MNERRINMPIIMISSAAHSLGKELASSLAVKTGWPVLNREQMAEQAEKRGIRLGRLETSIIKSPGVRERLAREKELYLAFITMILCEKGRERNLIYSGRAGHLLLPGVSHRLRVGLVAPKEIRIEKAMRDLRLSREKAESYLDKLDEDFDKWVRYVHHVDRQDPGYYDFFINLHNISLSNISVALCTLAELPDFSPTPASLRWMDDLYLAASARVRLNTDERTRNYELGVSAVGGVITVTYLPQQKSAAEVIPEVLEDLEGCKEMRCTMAETNILWVQESFNPKSDNFGQICRLAQRWGAAVELLRVAHRSDYEKTDIGPPSSAQSQLDQMPKKEVYTGGVEDDDYETPENDGGLARTLEELVSIGRSAGGHTVYGERDEIIETVEGSRDCSLVVLGDLFLDKGHETRMRRTRETALAIRERLKTPVITSDEMRSRILFGKKEAVKLMAFSALVACIYVLVFSSQGPILNFLGGEIHEKWKWAASIGVVLFVPSVAYIYSTVTALLLRLIGMD